MKRRTLLGLGASVASMAAITGATSTGFQPRRMPHLSVEPFANTMPSLNVNCELLNQADEHRPGRLRVSCTNTGTETDIFEFGYTPPFSSYRPRSRRSIVLFPSEARFLVDSSFIAENKERDEDRSMPPDEPIDGCWRKPPSSLFIPDKLNYVELAPGDSIDETYAVYTAESARTCFPVGAYEFVEENFAGTGETWGFTLDVSYSG